MPKFAEVSKKTDFRCGPWSLSPSNTGYLTAAAFKCLKKKREKFFLSDLAKEMF